VKDLVRRTIDQMELTPYKNKLAKDLSGGMKRKLCVAIALIGDPQVPSVLGGGVNVAQLAASRW
jgi:ABC-type multidrug transport system ATPase subunit